MFEPVSAPASGYMRAPTASSSSSTAPHSPFSGSNDPQSSSSHSGAAHRVPHTTAPPSSAVRAPQRTPSCQALAAVFRTPPLTRRLPQMIWRLQGVGSFAAVAKEFASDWASCTAPRAFRNPAPCVRWLYGLRPSAVYWRIALMRFGVSDGFAWSINAIVPLTTGDAMLDPVI